MKTRIHILMAALLMALSIPMQAQILTMDQEQNDRTGTNLNEFGRIPTQWDTHDQAMEFAPVGEGVLVLAALGGAYLLGKRRKKGVQD